MATSDQKPKETAEEFLTRWSKRKHEQRVETQTSRPPQPPATPATVAPELPPVEKLDMNSDYRGFFHPKVDEALRRTALKKLFSDPHFNIMDGLDVYIDDYSIPDPLPAAMLDELKQAQNIIGWARETEEAAELRRNPPPVAAERIAAADSGIEDMMPATDAVKSDAASPEPARQTPDDGGQNA